MDASSGFPHSLISTSICLKRSWSLGFTTQSKAKIQPLFRYFIVSSQSTHAIWEILQITRTRLSNTRGNPTRLRGSGASVVKRQAQSSERDCIETPLESTSTKPDTWWMTTSSTRNSVTSTFSTLFLIMLSTILLSHWNNGNDVTLSSSSGMPRKNSSSFSCLRLRPTERDSPLRLRLRPSGLRITTPGGLTSGRSDTTALWDSSYRVLTQV